MRGLGIVGAAAQLRPGSGALRTPARSTFPSYQSECGDGGSKSLTHLSMPPPGVGGGGLATGDGKGRTTPFGTGLHREPSQAGRNK